MRIRTKISDGWLVKQIDSLDIDGLFRELEQPDDSWLSASMPAQIHDVLLDHGRIPDPRVGRNAAESAWVGEKDWAYACKFAGPEETTDSTSLRFEGLDTLVDVYLNGAHVGHFENMFRTHVVNVSAQLRCPGNINTLLLIFHSPQHFIEQPRETARGVSPSKYLRKAYNDFSSYLGARPHSVKVGIFRDVILDSPDRAWFDDVRIRTTLLDDYTRATIDIGVKATGEYTSMSWALIGPDGGEVAKGSSDYPAENIEIELPEPALWWPWTHGAQNLYTLQSTLMIDGEAVDTRSDVFGVREILHVLKDPGTGEDRFSFVVNGRLMFLRGANWAPVEGMTHCWNETRASTLLDLAQNAHINTLRVWGGCDMPDRSFYDACDRRGLLVWQDFMFGYGLVPADDREFLENCRAEVTEVVRNLRNHPCIFMWVGGNENHMGYDFAVGGKPSTGNELFEVAMPEICERLDPTRPFHPSSPFGGPAPNWPLTGDWHDYTTITFSPDASVPLFASEIGRASAPSLSSMRKFMTEDTLWPTDHDPRITVPGRPAWPPMWQYRSVDGSWEKVGALEMYCDPKSAGDLIRVLGTAHGEYLRERIERMRRGVPDGSPDGNRRCWGSMPWRLNDPWPIIYWSVIDYYLEPKIPYYFLKRAYTPVLVCFERTSDRICVWIVNDDVDEKTGTLTVSRRRFNGEVMRSLSVEVSIAPNEAHRCLDLTEMGPISLRHEYLYASFHGVDATLLLTGERYLNLPKATLRARQTDDGIEISTDIFARQISLDVPDSDGVVFSDNYFDLNPGAIRTVKPIRVPMDGELHIEAVNADPILIRL